MYNIDSREKLMNDADPPNIIRVRQTYFNIKGLTIITNVSERTLYRLIKDEEFPGSKLAEGSYVIRKR